MSRLLWLWERSRLVYEFPRELLMPLTLPDIGFRVVCPAAARWLLWERSEVQRLFRERKWMPHSTASGRRIAQVGQYCFFGTALHLSQARWLSLLAHLLKPPAVFSRSYPLLFAPRCSRIQWKTHFPKPRKVNNWGRFLWNACWLYSSLYISLCLCSAILWRGFWHGKRVILQFHHPGRWYMAISALVFDGFGFEFCWWLEGMLFLGFV